MQYTSTDKYSLSVYNEGYRWWNRSSIEAGQIPVLFIPGSQGSAKQIRSLASVMQNKTEMRRSPFSFRFFAVDFDEEMTFLNGNIINRQLDYVMHAVRKIQTMMRVKRKIVLIGHSYGGVIALLATIHPDFHKDFELVIVKGAPLNKQPVVTDWLTMRLNKFLVNQWNILQLTDLKNVGVVAYTGGLRDYLIPDEWSKMRNITHRPLWAIDGVSDLGADHLAILWCNEFVRHVSRVLYSYAENLDKLTGRQVVNNFYNEDVNRNIKRANLVSHINEVPSKEIRLGEKYKDMKIKTEQSVLIIEPERFEILSVRVNATCVNAMTIVRNDESLMHFTNAIDGVVENWIYRASEGEKVRLLLKVTLPCSVDIKMTPPMTVSAWRFYEIMFSHIPEVGGTFITGCIFFSVLLREPSIHSFLLSAVVNIAAIVAVFHGSVDTSDELALPMAIGYFMAIIWRFTCYVVDSLILSKLGFVKKGHKALRDDMLINGLFLIGAAITIMASNEGSIFLILLLAYRHHPRSVLLAIPAIIPHVLKLVSVPLFTIDALAVYDIQYHPAFYAALIYLWGLFSSLEVGQVTMRILIYGLTPAILYLPTSPLELYSGYALLIFSSARFVPYSLGKSLATSTAATTESNNENHPQRSKQSYNLRKRNR
ncbi:hypothetical protein CAEBREN_29292 [Caenorhabditis brenneri]|uniref:GPI inositol-deacylase n=1 Tax=Caenorhabditis brenneri TaxID=135651 RepID=G0N8L9_CAEBE|nr:hypothetical protein CAEBREN_29292 [Caenorhabditis brenneri]